MNIIGIDYSLRSPALCVCDVSCGEYKYKNCRFYFLTDRKSMSKSFLNGQVIGTPYPTYSNDEERHDRIASWVTDIIKELSWNIRISIEGYAFGGTGRVFNIAENTGLLKHKLYRMGLSTTITPPTTIKKYATGKGNAKKEQMYDSFCDLTGTDIKSMLSPKSKAIGNPVSDIVDAFYIGKYLHHILIEESRCAD